MRSRRALVFGSPKVHPCTTLQHCWGCALEEKARLRTPKVLYCRAFFERKPLISVGLVTF